MDIAFTISHEAWYWKPEHPSVVGEIVVTRSNGQDSWEFLIVWRRHGDLPTFPQVEVADDAWAAFADIAPFFQTLASLDSVPTPDDVVKLLTDYGYTDTTQRERGVTANERRFLVLARLVDALDSTLAYCDFEDDEGRVDDSLPELLCEALETLRSRHGGDAQTLVRHHPGWWAARYVTDLASSLDPL